MAWQAWADLRDAYRQALSSAASLGVLLIGVQFSQATGRAVCLGITAAVGLFAGASAYLRARAIADIATSHIGSAAQGQVKLVGRASVAPGELIMSPVSGAACIWYRYTVYTRDNGGDRWQRVDSATSSSTFEIADASGACTYSTFPCPPPVSATGLPSFSASGTPFVLSTARPCAS